jgi:hypothetical protein
MVYSPSVPEKGDGQCAPPPFAATPFCINACWDTPGAPGPESCPPGAPELGARCCYPGHCGFDFGQGCTGSSLKRVDETVVAASPCAPPSEQPERIYEGTIDRVFVTENALAVVISNEGKLDYVSKTDCTVKQAYSGPPFRSPVLAGGLLYVISVDAAMDWMALLAISQAGEVKPFALAELFGGRRVYLSWLAASGASVYGYATADPTDVSTFPPALFEIPCCGGAPRIVAEGVSGLVGYDALVDGQTLVVGAETFPDDGPRASLAAFDLATRQARVFFDTFDGRMNPFALKDGRLYLQRGSSILSMSISDCSVAPIAERHWPVSITALAVDDGDVFWAENYDYSPYSGLNGSRLFVKRADGTEARVAQVSGKVTWIGLDSQTIYWVMEHDEREGKVGGVLVRRRRP